MISMAASARIVDPANPKTKWVFKTPQNDSLMADAIAVHMKANGVKTLGYIGFTDAYGDGWLAEIKRSAQTAGIKVVADEKYNRNDASVTGQVLKLVAANPDADPDRRVRHAGRDAAEGARRARLQGQDLPDARRRQSRLPARRAARTATARCCRSGPMLVYEQLPDSNPVKKIAARIHHASTRRSTARIRARRSAAMPGMRIMLLTQAIPEALKKAKPGTKEFRAALRDALESTNVVGTHGVFVMTPQRPQRPRQPRAGDDQDRERQVGAREVTLDA